LIQREGFIDAEGGLSFTSPPLFAHFPGSYLRVSVYLVSKKHLGFRV
jgi:hypothetical protein